MEYSSRANLIAAIRALEGIFSCNICCHDFSGQMIALFGKDNLPMEHTNEICREVKGHDEVFFNRCMKCDAEIVHQLGGNQQYYIKKCHAGICEAVVPVMLFKIQVGVLFAGPFSLGKDHEGKKSVCEQPGMSVLMPQMIRTIAKRPELDQRTVTLLLPLLLLIAEKIGTTLEEKTFTEKYSRKERIRFFFKQRHMSSVSENDLAGFLDLSATRVSQLLGEYFGKSFPTLLTETRLDFAENALIHSASPIGKIAKLSGFGTTAYFYRAFKKQYRMTPAEFRQIHQGSERPSGTARLP